MTGVAELRELLASSPDARAAFMAGRRLGRREGRQEADELLAELKGRGVFPGEAVAPTLPGLGRLGDAVEFLRRELSDGPQPGRDVLRAALAAGHSRRTVERARVELGARTGRGPGARWALS